MLSNCDMTTGLTGTAMKTFIRVLSILTVLFVAACDRVASVSVVDVETLSAEEIYQAGERAMAIRGNETAASYFSEIERLFPYSDWASRGLVMQAFALHKAKKYDDSRSAAQRYLTFYPTLDDADWAQYLIALSYYDQIYDVGRDQALTINALQELRKVIETYPESEYADEARPRFDLAFDHLAAKEMEVGRYYLSKQEYVAAINRFRVVVEDFQTTRHTPEALYRLAEAYLALGLGSEAQSALAILQNDFATNEWTADAMVLLGNQGVDTQNFAGSGWLARVYRQTVKGDWL
jgi:outer membrane protein assembly factor BamD